MRISDVTPLVVGTPWRNLTIVRVRTDEGLEGVGEVRMVNHTDALLGYLKYAAPTHVLGADPFDVESLVQRMRIADFERAGSVEMSGAAAVEIACWDVMGKALGVPVYRLLGGAVRDRIKAYANGWYTVERTPEEFHAAARRVVERGYDALKVDPFGAGSAELEPEQERRWIVLVAPHNVGGAISTAAALHVAASTPNFKIQEHFNDFAEEYVKQVAPGNPEVRDGHFALPAGPGLGVTLDEAVAREHPMRDLHFDLYAEGWHFRDVDRADSSPTGPTRQ